MATQLTGEVGRSGRAEDVAVVQVLLANIKGANGRPFWDRVVDGRPGAGLAAAIEAFQRRWVEVAVAGGSVDTGMVRPQSRTLQALTSLAPRSLDGLRAATVSPVVLYVQDDPQGRAARNHADAVKVPGATVGNLSAIQQAQALLAQRRRLAVKIGKSGLAGDRWGFRIALDGLIVIEADGRPRTVDDRPESIPAAVWRLVDGEFAGLFETGGGGELTGPNEIYREWGRSPYLERLLDVYRNVREAVTNPVNAQFRPDDQLAKYRKRVAATAMAVTIARRLTLLRDVFGAAKNSRDAGQWGTFGDLLLEILQYSNDRALGAAKAELDRRIAAL